MLKHVVALVVVLALAGASLSQQTAVSPDAKVQAVAKGDTVVIVDVGSGKELRAIKAHTGNVTGVAFSPDGKLLASVGKDKKLNLMELATGKLIATAALADEPTALQISPDGKTITAKEGNSEETFEAATLKKLK